MIPCGSRDVENSAMLRLGRYRQLWSRTFATALVTCAGVAVVLTVSPQVSAEPKVPDFNGIWGKYTYSYPKPYMRGRNIADGYDNAFLKPWVVDLLMQDELVSAS